MCYAVLLHYYCEVRIPQGILTSLALFLWHTVVFLRLCFVCTKDPMFAKGY